MSKGAFTRQTKVTAYKRDEESCARCGQGLAFDRAQFHHRRPRGAGGTSNPVIALPSNCLTLCGDCHSWVESHRERAHAAGFLVYQAMDPAEVSVRHAIWGAVHLTESGTEIGRAHV